MRWLKYFASTLFALLLLLVLALWGLTGTERGYRGLIALLNRVTPYHLSYDALQGDFWHGQSFHNVHLSGPALDFRAETLRLDNCSALMSMRFCLQKGRLKNAVLELKPQPAAPTAPSTPPKALPQLRFPIGIAVEDFQVENLRLVQGTQTLWTLKQGQISAHYRDGAFDAHTQLDSTLGRAEADLKARFEGDWPLALTAQAAQEGEQLALAVSGSALKPQWRLTATGAWVATATGSAALDLAQQTLKTELSWRDVGFKKVWHSPRGSLRLAGPWSRLQLQAQGAAQGAQFPALQLQAQGELRPQALEKMNATLSTLGGTLALRHGHFDWARQAWTGRLEADHLDLQKFRPELGLTLAHLHAETQGQWAEQQAAVQLKALAGTWQGLPLAGQGQLGWQGTSLVAAPLKLSLGANHLALSGRLGRPQEVLTATLDAPKLQQLLPKLQGNLGGVIALSGALTQPEISAALHWQNLGWGATLAEAWRSPRGTLTGKGPLRALDVQTQLDFIGPGLSLLHGRGHFIASPDDLRNLVLAVQAGPSRAQIAGAVRWNPHVAWTATAHTEALNPALFLPKEAQGALNATLRHSGRVDAQGVVLDTAISRLDGTLAGRAVSGRGSFHYQRDALRVPELDLNLADNRLKASGRLEQGRLNFDLALDARALGRLAHQAGGMLAGKGHLGGTLAAPQISWSGRGQNLRFADQSLGALTVALASDFSRPTGAFNNTLTLENLRAGGQHIPKLQLKTQGQIQAQQWQLLAQAEQGKLRAQAQGGFLGDFKHWRGRIAALNLAAEKKQWRLQKPAPLSFSPQKIALEDFCLQDAFSKLCASVEKAQMLNLRYQIAKLSPQSFPLPPLLHLSSTAQGSGALRLKDGQIWGTAALNFTPGTLRIAPAHAPPVTLKLQQGGLKARFAGQKIDAQAGLKFAQAGQISGAVILDAQRHLTGEAKVLVPNIGQFRYLLPLVSELKGQIAGNLRLSGTTAAPVLGGVVKLTGGRVVIPKYDSELRDIVLNLAAQKSGQIDINGRVGTPGGALDIAGKLHLLPTLLNLHLEGKNLQLARAENMSVTASPRFDIAVNPKSGIDIKGKLVIPRANISLPDLSNAQVPSKDVVILGKDQRNGREKLAQVQTPFHANIAVDLGQKVFFAASKIRLQLIGGLTVLMRPHQVVTARGTIGIAQGQYQFYGQELDVQRGKITWSGGNIANPSIDLLALRQIDKVRVGAAVTGTVNALHLALTAKPQMPDAAILSYLIFGRPPSEATNSQALLQMAADTALGGVLPGDLAQKTGLDVLTLGISGVKAGKYLGKDLYVGLQSNFFKRLVELLARYQFSRRLKAEASASTHDKALDLIYEFESN